MRKALLIFLGFFIAATSIWGGLAFFYTGPNEVFFRVAVVVIYLGAAISALTAIILQRKIWHFCLTYLCALILMLTWFFNLTPINERQWQTDVARLPSASVNHNLVTIRNVRNFDYRTESDYSPKYYDKVYDLNKLKGLDLIAVYWMGPAIAHIFVSFDFGENNHLAISIETRKELGEEYSTIKGFFRQYELYYVVADERDVIGLRTNYRTSPPEDVYVYRTSTSLSNARAVFMEYINKINSLNKVPEFYNTLTTNCTTNIWKHTLINESHLPFSWKILASGYVPEYLYENNALETKGLSFQALRKSSYVNEKAQQIPADPDFSSKLRKSSAFSE